MKIGFEYAKLYYESGMSMKQIAEKYGVNTSTISRCINRANEKVCPFASNCFNCPLDDCAIKDEYAYLINRTTNKKKRKTKTISVHTEKKDE